MNRDPKLAKERLQDASQRKDKVKRWGWLMAVAAVVLLVLLGFASMDYWLMLPPHLRYGAMAVLACLAGLGGWGLRRLCRKPTPLKEAALDAEEQRPDFGCVVSTAAEYASGKASMANEYEPQLANALQTEAARRLEQVELPYRRKLWRPLSACGIAVAAGVIFVSVTPGAWTALKRVVFPWLRVPYTEVAVKPGDIEVRVGNEVEVASVFSGRPPRDPRIYWQQGDNPAWQAVSLQKAANGAFVYPFKNVTVPVKYHVTGGDAVSPDFQVTPYLPPEIQHFSVTLRFPDYTHLKPLTQNSPEITALRGSMATLHLQANVELSRARLRLADTNAPLLELRPGENQLWTTTFPIQKDADYRIELFDKKGRPSENPKWHHLAAKTDAPPRVEILEPAQDMRADATNKIPVKISAADDYGVAEIRLVFHKLNSAERTVVCPPQSEKNGEALASGEIDLSSLDLKRYDVVTYHAEAKDNNTLDGPGVGRSAVYFIEITDKESSPAAPQKGQVDQVNLVVVQKQIIADTVQLLAASASTNFLELAGREKDAVELGRLYRQALVSAPTEVLSEMDAAMTAMESATAHLEKRDQQRAVASEEEALARLYRVLALMPDLKLPPVVAKPQPPKPSQPQFAVSLREIRKPNTSNSVTNSEIAAALEQAKEIKEAQEDLNQAEQKLAQANRKEAHPPGPAPNNSENPARSNDQANAKAPGNQQGDGDGQGQGDGQGKAQGQAKAKAQGEQTGDPRPGVSKMPIDSAKQNQPDSRTNNAANLAQGGKNDTADKEPNRSAEAAKKDENSKGEAELASEKASDHPPKDPPQLAQLQHAPAKAAKAGKGHGKGKGRAKGGGQRGKGKGQGRQPGDGSGQPSDQPPEPPTLAPGEPPETESEPPSAEELAQQQQELSQEAKALGEILERLAGKGQRVGHNLARSANKASEHMEGAAQALKQGNAAGAGMRGTQSTAELDQVVSELERLLAKRPDLTDVAAEQAPKEYEAFISEYFKKLSYEK